MTDLSPDAIDALCRAEIDGNRLVLPDQLPRTVYVEVDKALQRLGGKWNRSAKAHLFAADPSGAVAACRQLGVMPRDATRDAAFFRTPTEVADRVIYAAGLYDPVEMRVLEPSAGDGALADAAGGLYPWRKLNLVCVEPDPGRAGVLAGKGYGVKVSTFEEYAASGEPWLFDAVIMNPPFATPGHPVLWAEHVLLAWQFVRPGGKLAAVIPANLERQHRTVAEVRQLVDEHGHVSMTLPEGSFKESGTGIRTKILVLERES